MTRLLPALFLLFSQTVFAESEKSPPGLGIWSWSRTNFSTPEARERLFEFCAREGISHIDQHVGMTKTKDGYVVADDGELRLFLKEARQRNLSINALRGERTMFFEKNHERTLEQLATILRFNESQPGNARFAGLKYDVEPYLSPEWRAGGDSRKKVISDYLSFLEKAGSVLDEQAGDLDLSVDVPFWWDKPEYASRLNNKEQLFIHHIIDLTDWIGIMSYRRDADEVLRLSKEELDYARQIRKPHSVAPGLNVAEAKGEAPKVSFHGLPPADFRKALARLRENLAGDETTRFIMLHDYKSLVKYLEAE